MEQIPIRFDLFNAVQVLDLSASTISSIKCSTQGEISPGAVEIFLLLSQF